LIEGKAATSHAQMLLSAYEHLFLSGRAAEGVAFIRRSLEAAYVKAIAARSSVIPSRNGRYCSI